MRRWVIRFAIVIAMVAVGWILRRTVFAPSPLVVDVITIARGRVEATVTNSRAGTVKARRRAKLSPEFGGQAVRIPYREGETVRAGEVVLELDNRLQKARLVLAERDLDAAQSRAEQVCLEADRARQKADRTRRLADEAIVSADLLDEVESGRLAAAAACAAARSDAARAQAAIDLARTELDKTLLRSPFDGIVAEVSAEVGEWVTPSPPALPVPPVIDVLDPTSIYISAPMDEVDSAAIHPGQAARVTVDSHRGQDFPGVVSRVSPYVLDIEEQNRTVGIEVELDDSDFAATLLPGTSADVEVILTVHDDVLRIPTAALMEGQRVLILAGDRLEERKIDTSLRNWDFTEIAAGLDEGEQVVTSLDRAEVQAGVEAVAADASEN